MTTTNIEEDSDSDMDYGPNGPCLNSDDETDSKETPELLAAKEMVRRLEAKAIENAKREETQTQELPMKVEMVQESDQGKKK